MKNELKTTARLEITSNTDAIFSNLHIDKARKTHLDKHVCVITHFTKNFRPKLFTADIKCNSTALKLPKTERAILFSADCTIGMVWGLTSLKHQGTMAILHYASMAIITVPDRSNLTGNALLERKWNANRTLRERERNANFMASWSMF